MFKSLTSAEIMTIHRWGSFYWGTLKFSGIGKSCRIHVSNHSREAYAR